MTGFNIAFRVPDKIRVLGTAERHIEHLKRPLNRTDAGFAAIAAIFRMMNAIKDLADLSAGLSNVSHHVPGNVIELFLRIKALPDTGLIGDNKDLETLLREMAQGLQRSGQKPEFFDLGHIFSVSRKLIDHPVTIKKYDFRSHTKPFQISVSVLFNVLTLNSILINLGGNQPK